MLSLVQQKNKNRASSWFVHGFVEDQKLLSDQKNYMRCDKMQDYHDMMSKAFQEMKLIYDSGGVDVCNSLLILVEI